MENDDNEEEIPYETLPSFSLPKEAFNPEGYEEQRYIDPKSAQEFLNHFRPTKDKYLQKGI